MSLQNSPYVLGDEKPIVNNTVAPDNPPPPPSSSPREPKPKTPPTTYGEIKKNGVMKTQKKKNRIEPEELEMKKQPEVPFVLTKRKRKQTEKEAAIHLDQYINKRINNGHAWRPYLWERKQFL